MWIAGLASGSLIAAAICGWALRMNPAPGLVIGMVVVAIVAFWKGV